LLSRRFTQSRQGCHGALARRNGVAMALGVATVPVLPRVLPLAWLCVSVCPRVGFALRTFWEGTRQVASLRSATEGDTIVAVSWQWSLLRECSGLRACSSWQPTEQTLEMRAKRGLNSGAKSFVELSCLGRDAKVVEAILFPAWPRQSFVSLPRSTLFPEPRREVRREVGQAAVLRVLCVSVAALSHPSAGVEAGARLASRACGLRIPVLAASGGGLVVIIVTALLHDFLLLWPLRDCVVTRRVRAVVARLAVDSLEVVFSYGGQLQASPGAVLVVVFGAFERVCVTKAERACVWCGLHRCRVVCGIALRHLPVVVVSLVLAGCELWQRCIAWLPCILSGALVVLVEVLLGPACVVSAVLLAAVFSLMVSSAMLVDFVCPQGAGGLLCFCVLSQMVVWAGAGMACCALSGLRFFACGFCFGAYGSTVCLCSSVLVLCRLEPWCIVLYLGWLLVLVIVPCVVPYACGSIGVVSVLVWLCVALVSLEAEGSLLSVCLVTCAVHPKEFSRVSTCKLAKEMWDKLEIIYKGHMRGECPELKKTLKNKFTFKKAKAMMATWSDEDEDDNAHGSSKDEEIQCLMARSEDSNEVVSVAWDPHPQEPVEGVLQATSVLELAADWADSGAEGKMRFGQQH
ncbi:hypothetical protein Taro_011287, partial [Colocasia esculenta]|nr:hypothetical protein [Colocasia esculenta]